MTTESDTASFVGAAYQTSLIDAIEEVSREQAEQAAEPGAMPALGPL